MQANQKKKMVHDFLKSTNTKLRVIFEDTVLDNEAGEPLPPEEMYNVYEIQVSRGGQSWLIEFTDTPYNYRHRIKPDAYDILSESNCYPVGDFARYRSLHKGCGYTQGQIKKMYEKAKNEYKNVMRVFGDVIWEFRSTFE